MRNDRQFRIANYNILSGDGLTDTAYIDGVNKGVHNQRNTYTLLFKLTPVIGAAFGTNTNNTFGSRGDVAEIIFYDENTTEQERQQIETYLAVKYGVTLNNGNSDYLNTAGDSVWAADATYKHNIAGIASEDAEALHQKQSQSINEGIQVAIGLGELAGTNAANTNELTDQQYLIWGDNGEANIYTAYCWHDRKVPCRAYLESPKYEWR